VSKTHYYNYIALPILNGLTPTTESCTMKVLEEVGELMQLIGKGQGKSGEELTCAGGKIDWAIRAIMEAIDTAQSAITMAHTMCEEHNIDLSEMMDIHSMKLAKKGYLVRK